MYFQQNATSSPNFDHQFIHQNVLRNWWNGFRKHIPDLLKWFATVFVFGLWLISHTQLENWICFLTIYSGVFIEISFQPSLLTKFIIAFIAFISLNFCTTIHLHYCWSIRLLVYLSIAFIHNHLHCIYLCPYSFCISSGINHQLQEIVKMYPECTRNDLCVMDSFNLECISLDWLNRC
jgi:hypothetical protein